MKKSIITTLYVMFGAVLSSNAALYTVTNNTGGAAATPIVNSSGANQLSGSAGNVTGGAGALAYSTIQGVAAIGYFDFNIPDDGILTDGDLSGASKASILGAFKQFGAASLFSATVANTFTRGLFSAATSQTIGVGGAFDQKSIYVLVGAGAATLADSTEFLILKTASIFDVARDANPAALSVPISGTSGSIPTVLLGEYNQYSTRTTALDSTTTPAWNTVVPVPEPSSAALGLFAGLGLLARRRRA